MNEVHIFISVFSFSSNSLMQKKTSVHSHVRSTLVRQLKSQCGYDYKSSAKINESVLRELIGDIEFIIKRTVYFIMIHKR